MIRLFAKDFKLLFSSLNFHNKVTRLYNWNLSNEKVANLGKTNCLYLKGLTSVTINDCLLKNVVYIKSLGNIVSHNLKWSDSVQMKLTKIQRRFYSLKQKIQQIFLTSVICSFIWDTISITRYNSFEINGKFSKKVLQMDFWYKHLLSTATHKSLRSSHLSPY